MTLTSPQQKQLADALLAAFPMEQALIEMVRYHLDASLNELAGSGVALSTLVFRLVEWAVARDRVSELIAAAQAANPTNTNLQIAATVIRQAAGQMTFVPPPVPDTFVARPVEYE